MDASHHEGFTLPASFQWIEVSQDDRAGMLAAKSKRIISKACLIRACGETGLSGRILKDFHVLSQARVGRGG